MDLTFHLMVVSAQVEALCYSVILEEPPEHAGIRCLARALTNLSHGEGKSPDDVVRPEGAVCHCHILAGVLSQNILVEEDEDGQGQQACGHFDRFWKTTSPELSI